MKITNNNRKIAILLCSLLFIVFSSVAQSSIKKNELQSRVGMVFFDLFPNKYDYKNVFFSYHTVNDISYTRTFTETHGVRFRAAIGYTFLYILSAEFYFKTTDVEIKDYFSLANLKVGVEKGYYKEKLTLSLHYSSQFLLNKVLHNKFLSKRYFATVEPELKFKLFPNFKIGIYSPIGVVSPFRGKFAQLKEEGGEFEPYRPFVEINGIGVGLSYIW